MANVFGRNGDSVFSLKRGALHFVRNNDCPLKNASPRTKLLIFFSPKALSWAMIYQPYWLNLP